MKKYFFAAICIIAVPLFFSSCVSGAINSDLIDGKIWQLQSLTDAKTEYEIPSDSKVTLIIDADRAYGNAGINSYNGSANIANKTVKIGPFAATLMGGDEKRMSFERTYLQILQGVNQAEFENGKLILTNKKETTKMVFIEFKLEGTKWQLSGYNTGNAIVSDILCENAYIEFNETGKISGTSGYNRFNGTWSYTAEGSLMNITISAMTRMAPPPEAANFEQQLVNFLNSTKKISCNGNSLQLMNEEGTTLLGFHLFSD